MEITQRRRVKNRLMIPAAEKVKTLPCKRCKEPMIVYVGLNGIPKNRVCDSCKIVKRIDKKYGLKRCAVKSPIKPLKRVSAKQAVKNRGIAKIKKSLPDQCFVSGCFSKDLQLMHILNKGTYPQYYLAQWNHTKGCQKHHDLFDNNIQFRQTQIKLYCQIATYDRQSADNYFHLSTSFNPIVKL